MWGTSKRLPLNLQYTHVSVICTIKLLVRRFNTSHEILLAGEMNQDWERRFSRTDNKYSLLFRYTVVVDLSNISCTFCTACFVSFANKATCQATCLNKSTDVLHQQSKKYTYFSFFTNTVPFVLRPSFMHFLHLLDQKFLFFFFCISFHYLYNKFIRIHYWEKLLKFTEISQFE